MIKRKTLLAAASTLAMGVALGAGGAQADVELGNGTVMTTVTNAVFTNLAFGSRNEVLIVAGVIHGDNDQDIRADTIDNVVGANLAFGSSNTLSILISGVSGR